MNASVKLHVNSTPQHETPLIDIRFRASQLRIENRLIAPLSAQIGNAKQRNTLLVSKLKGSCYGGVLIGTGRVDMNGTETSKKVRYLADLKLQDVAYAKFTEPEKKEDEALKKKKPDPTTLSVSLLLEGVADEPASKRGRGQVRVRDAALYELPVAMAVLHLLNFTLPRSSAFDKVDARYMIEGDRVRFDSVAIQSPTIEIYGDGMMEYPTRKVDLLMHTQNPGAPKLGGLTEIFNVVKDTLISIHVTGTLEKPKASIISLRGAARSWEQVFGPLTRRIPKSLPRGPLRLLPGKDK
jgi:hypothetical protein